MIISERRIIVPSLTALLVSMVLILVACGSDESSDPAALPSSVNTSSSVVTDTVRDSKMKGTIEIDGSSTVYPISEAVAEEFNKLYPKVRINVGVSGTGGGFKRFGIGETDLSDASRPMKNPKETSAAEKNGIRYTELRLGTDGLSVMVSPSNDFVES